MTTQLEQAWDLAKQRFAAVGVDVEEALRQLDRLPVSMHCWQGDDVAGLRTQAVPDGVFRPRVTTRESAQRHRTACDLELALA
ncbi:MAG: L-rhamnose isomerase [Enterobacter hormaechei]